MKNAKHLCKRGLALLLALMMCVGMLSVTASATPIVTLPMEQGLFVMPSPGAETPEEEVPEEETPAEAPEEETPAETPEETPAETPEETDKVTPEEETSEEAPETETPEETDKEATEETDKETDEETTGEETGADKPTVIPMLPGRDPVISVDEIWTRQSSGAISTLQTKSEIATTALTPNEEGSGHVTGDITIAQFLAAAADGGKIVLDNDTTITDGPYVFLNGEYEIDLATHTLTLAESLLFSNGSAGGNVTMKNGTVNGNGVYGYSPLYSQKGGKWTLNKVTIETDGPMALSLNSGIAELDGCTIRSTTGHGISVLISKSELTVKNSEIEAGGYGIVTNGSDTHAGAQIELDGVTITAGTHGMFLPSQNGTTTIENSSITGDNTGIEIRAGELTVENSTVIGNGTYNSTKNNSGTTASGAGIAIAQHTTKQPITVTVKGDKTVISGDVALSVADPQGNAEANDPSIDVQGGTFTGKKAAVQVDKAIQNNDSINNGFISGGSFSDRSADAYVTEGTLLPNGDGTYGIGDGDKNSVAYAGGKGYADLKEAIAAAATAEDHKVTLLEDVSVDGALTIESTVKLNLDTHKLTVGGSTGTYFTVASGASLTIEGTGTIQSSGFGILVKGGLTIDGVTVEAASTAVYAYGGSTVTVRSGVLKSSINAITMADATEGARSTLTITGGTFDSPNNRDSGNVFELGANCTTTISEDTGAVLVNSNGYGIFQKGANGVLRISGGVFQSDKAAALSGNGNVDGTEILISGGTFTGGQVGIYQPQAGTLTITGGEISGKIGILIRDGVIDIQGGKITGTGGSVGIGDKTRPLSGGNAIVVDQTNKVGYGTDLETFKVTITDGTLIAGDGTTPVVVYDKDINEVQEAEKANLTVKGGYYSSSVDEIYLDETLNVELKGKTAEGQALYSYHEDPAEAVKAAEEAAYTDAEITDLAAKDDEAQTVTITFDAGEGTVSLSQMVVVLTEDGKVEYLPTPTRDGYNFAGWFTEDGEQYTADTVVPEGTTVITLTAHWTAIPTPPTSTGGSRGGGGSTGGNVNIVEEDVPLTELPFTFIDIADGDWFYDAVKYVFAAGLMQGVGDDEFAPGSTTTRAMLMTILARMDGVDTDGGSSWYEKAMEWAVENGVSDGTNPEGAITREQLATMLWRYLGQPEASGDAVSAFPDASSVSDWAKDAMIWAVENGIINGSDGMLNPQTGATRAEMATMLMRFCEKYTTVV